MRLEWRILNPICSALSSGEGDPQQKIFTFLPVPCITAWIIGRHHISFLISFPPSLPPFPPSSLPPPVSLSFSQSLSFLIKYILVYTYWQCRLATLLRCSYQQWRLAHIKSRKFGFHQNNIGTVCFDLDSPARGQSRTSPQQRTQALCSLWSWDHAGAVILLQNEYHLD